ncbi:sulfotransferase [Thiospirillum jenense]|uniref:Sulfotransferase n=1 Tax=Thiospirillum jenense TaxID=1653858 RepID=A0A839HL20_9GAMM|nr:sulfotransferase [Thiospirillum jenense]MBB1126432.1 sulfotransferase [Thiospirillum jenense]
MLASVLIISAIVLSYTLIARFSHFPYWPTYFLLWRYVLLNWSSQVTLTAKYKQAVFLLKCGLMNPIWTLFWYLDEWLFPEYRFTMIKPIFIVGQPRSGTTLLHRTLANDYQHFFAIRHSEWRYPFICVQQLFALFGINRRLATKNYWPNTVAGRLAAKMHPDTLADWEEDGIFFEECFLHHFFIFLRFPYPTLLHTVDQFQSLPAGVRQQMLNTHHLVIKKIAYLRQQPTAYYLSKEVTSHTKIPALIALYPEARFIIVTRPAAAFMSSLSGLMRTSTQAKNGIDPMSLPNWHDVFIQRMRDDSLYLTGLCQQQIPLERQIPITWRHLVSQLFTTINAIYQQLELELPNDFSIKLKQLDEYQQKRQRQYDYDMMELTGFEQFDQFVKTIEIRFNQLIIKQ